MRWFSFKRPAAIIAATENRNLPNSLRHKVHLRDKKRCQNPLCFSSGKIEIHHIFDWSTYPTKRHDLSNLISLCHSCHSGYHGFNGGYHRSTSRATLSFFFVLFGGRIMIKAAAFSFIWLSLVLTISKII